MASIKADFMIHEFEKKATLEIIALAKMLVLFDTHG